MNSQQFKSGEEVNKEKVKSKTGGTEKTDTEQQATDTGILRTEAILASRYERPSLEQARTAYELWKSLAVDLKYEDITSLWNAGFWASVIARKDKLSARTLFKDAKQYYEKALKLESDNYKLIHNMGVVLTNEAAMMSDSNLEDARVLWSEARSRFTEAFKIKPDSYESLIGIGDSYLLEAKALASSDLVIARGLWKDARQSYERVLNLKPDVYKAAENLCVALAEEAKALAPSDLIDAITLWKEVGERFEKLIKVKPDRHSFVNYWATSLLEEYHALKKFGLMNESTALFKKAKYLLENQVNKYSDAKKELAYNLACVYSLENRATDAITQLEISLNSNNFPGRDHLLNDKDFNPIRSSPEFQVWWKKNFENS